MISKAADVETYIAESPVERRYTLEKIRSLCKKELKGCKESMEYGMPVYKRDDRLIFAFASQKQYIAVYPGDKPLDEFREAFPGSNCGKGCLRFTKPEKINFDTLKQLIGRANQSRVQCEK